MRIDLPPLPLTGGCQCGAVRYTVTAPPVTFYVCHCRACQRQSGSAFGESLLVLRTSLDLAGPTSGFETLADSGNRSHRTFCAECGTRLYHRRMGAEVPTVSLKAGTLDETGWLRPVAHIWTARRQPWVTIPPELPDYPGQPDMAELRAAWDAALAR